MTVRRVAPRQRGDVRLVSLSPDGRFVAYGMVRGIEADVVLAPVESDGAPSVVVTWPYPPRRFSWSPDGAGLAFLIGGPTAQAGGDRVGWCRWGGKDGAKSGRRRGNDMTWLDGERLLVADARGGEIVGLGLDGEPELTIPLAHDGHPSFPPRLAVHGGSRLSFSTRSAEEMVAALWRGDLDGEPSLVSEMPTAKVAISPFFSEEGVLAVHLVHRRGSAIIVFDDPEGRVVYESAVRDLPEAPAWTTAGIVWFRRTDPESPTRGSSVLSLLDPETGDARALTRPGVTGRLWCGVDGELRIDTDGAAYGLDVGALATGDHPS